LKLARAWFDCTRGEAPQVGALIADADKYLADILGNSSNIDIRALIGLLFLDQGLRINDESFIDVPGDIICKCLNWK
jgi:hypothetical protein